MTAKKIHKNREEFRGWGGEFSDWPEYIHLGNNRKYLQDIKQTVSNIVQVGRITGHLETPCPSSPSSGSPLVPTPKMEVCACVYVLILTWPDYVNDLG